MQTKIERESVSEQPVHFESHIQTTSLDMPTSHTSLATLLSGNAVRHAVPMDWNACDGPRFWSFIKLEEKAK